METIAKWTQNPFLRVKLPPRKQLWRRILLACVFVVFAGIAALWGWVQWKARHSLQLAVAEADRLDPGWRLLDQMAARRHIPDTVNSAGRVADVAMRMPVRWPQSEHPSIERLTRLIPGSEDTPDQDANNDLSAALSAKDIEDAVRKAPANVALTEDIEKGVERLLKPLSKALIAARSMAGAGEGRYEFSLGEVAIAFDIPHIEAARSVFRMLSLDSANQSQLRKIDDALTSARGIIGVARSIGDEPVELSQLVRLALRKAALSAILRALGQGEATDPVLAAVQDDLAHESEHDLLLCAMRAQRAAYFDTLGKMADGAYARYAEGDFPPLEGRGNGPSPARAGAVPNFLYVRAYCLYNQAVALSILTQSDEGAKYPPFDPRWNQHWMAFERGFEGGNRFERRLAAIAYTILPLNLTVLWGTYESLARIKAARTLIAAERYRLAHGRWPEQLADVIPCYLREVPRGPYSDRPLRYVRRNDRIIVYTLGFNSEDNGGRLHPDRKREPKFDVGDELWNPEHRHKPAMAAPSSDP
jgi:hypothetical protein